MTFAGYIVSILATCSVALAAPAQEAATTAPHSLLEQLNRETRAVYQDVQSGVVRLQLPPPKWLTEAASRDNPIDKWGGQLAAQVREKLEQDRQASQQGKPVRAGPPRITPATQSASNQQPSPWRVTQEAGSNTLVIESAGTGTGSILQIQTGGGIQNGQVTVGGPPQLTLQPASTFSPNNVGLIFDDAGNVLVPLYLERETVGDGVRASVGEGPVVNASFVASDKQTNLTVLKLPTHSGKALKLGTARPAEGSLILLLAPNSASAKLMLWTGGQRDVAGVVVMVDGSVSGFARYGQFLCAGSCKTVVEQLVQNGRVKRAILGVTVREVPRNDPARERPGELGLQPALRVEEVRPDSAAARADLQRGDLILNVAGESVGDPASFAVAISNRAGITPMRVLRNGSALELSVELHPE